jgi:hypothetical protein
MFEGRARHRPEAAGRGTPAFPVGTSDAINGLFTTRGKDGRLEDESFPKGPDREEEDI